MNLLDLFRHQTDLQALPAGQVLFKEGERGNFMYVLMSGTAEIIVRNRVMETAEAGTIVGEMAIMDDSARSATVLAKAIASFYLSSAIGLLFLFSRNPNLRYISCE